MVKTIVVWIKIGTSMNELASIESLDPEYKSLSDTVQNAYYYKKPVEIFLGW